MGAKQPCDSLRSGSRPQSAAADRHAGPGSGSGPCALRSCLCHSIPSREGSVQLQPCPLLLLVQPSVAWPFLSILSALGELMASTRRQGEQWEETWPLVIGTWRVPGQRHKQNAVPSVRRSGNRRERLVSTEGTVGGHGERWFLLGIERWIETEVQIMEGAGMTKRRNSMGKFQEAWRGGKAWTGQEVILVGKVRYMKGTC